MENTMSNDDLFDTDESWLSVCGEFIEDGLHCGRCGQEPPWGCPCSDCQGGHEHDADCLCEDCAMNAALDDIRDAEIYGGLISVEGEKQDGSTND